MKFGISTYLTDETMDPVELGRAVEERGFDSLFIAEHSHVPVGSESQFGSPYLPPGTYRTLAPFVALAAAAAVTEKILLGTSIALMIQRDPIHTAKELATLDLISHGRTVFGVGVGWNRSEMSNHGTDPTTRGALLNEQIRAIREIWTHEHAEFHGTYVNFDPIISWPKPVQQPLPIYIGGEGQHAQRRAASLGDGWLPSSYQLPDNLADVIAAMRDTAGRDIPVTIHGEFNENPPIGTYREAGVERVLFQLMDQPRDEALTHLDILTTRANSFR